MRGGRREKPKHPRLPLPDRRVGLGLDTLPGWTTRPGATERETDRSGAAKRRLGDGVFWS